MCVIQNLLARYRGKWRIGVFYRQYDVVRIGNTYYEANSFTSTKPPGAAWN